MSDSAKGDDNREAPVTSETSRRLAAVWVAEIAGPGDLAASDEDRSGSVARELRRTARTEVEARDGLVADLAGGGVVAVFDGVDDGVGAALDVRSEVLESAQARAADLSLRIGLHVGEVIRTPAGEVRGDAVTVASGIVSRAEAGQVVLSDVAYRLLRDRSALTLEELGEFELEGLAEPVGLYAVAFSEEAGEEAVRELLEDALAPLQLLDLRDEGGMGEIYLARDPSLRRTLAVKVLRSELAEDPDARRRFFREAQVIAGLSHPNVIGVHSVGELADGTPYFVMDYVEGGSLADRLEREGPLPAREVKRILGEVASALKAAHSRGVVHRDIKASNILYDAETGRSLVTDWGIAALDPTVSMAPETRLTRTGMFVGSPQYMSPEQLAGDEVGPETDLYSLGLLGFELATGRAPFPAETPREIMIAHLREDPTRLSEAAEGVDPELDSLVERCLFKDPHERPTAEEVAQRFAPEGEAVLEWPPPGLEGLRNAAARPLRDLTLGLVLWIGAALLLETPTAHVVMGGTFAVFVVALLLTTVGLGLGLLGAWRLIRLGRRVRAAGELGYGWRTLLDAMADRRGDTGALIAGVREYAGVPGAKRARLRAGRRHLLVLRVAILVLLVPSVVLVVSVGAEPGLLPTVVAALLGVPLLTSLLGLVILTGCEWITVGRARRALREHRTPRSVLRSLVEPWYASLKLVTGEGGEGRRGSGRTRLGTGVAWAVFGALVFGALLAFPVFFAGVIGSLRPLIEMPKFSQTDEKWQIARVVEDLRVPVDSSLSVEEASGIAWGMIWSSGQSSVSFTPPPEEHRLPDWRPDDLFDSGNPFGVGFGELADSLVIMGSRGLTPEQRAWIRENASHPLFEALSRVATAPALDLVGARHADSLPEGLVLPIPKFPGTREVAYWAQYRAALLVSEGAPEEAERELRELISYGFLLAEQPTLITNLIGVVIVGIARNGLVQLYEVTDRGAEARTIRNRVADVDSAYAGPAGLERDVRPGLYSEDAGEMALSLVESEEVVRGLRWEMLLMFDPMAACQSPGRVLAGPEDEWRAAVEAAGEELVRHPGEERLYQWARRWPERAAAAVPDGRLSGAVHGLGRLSGAALGNERIPACTVLALLTTEETLIPSSWKSDSSPAANWVGFFALLLVVVGIAVYAMRRLVARRDGARREEPGGKRSP